MRTLHFSFRVADPDRSLAFYRALGYEVVGRVPDTPQGDLTMIKLPADEFVSIELVHAPDHHEPGPDSALSCFVIAVESMEATVAALATHGIGAETPRRRMARPTSSRRGSSIPTATASSWCSGRPGTPSA